MTHWESHRSDKQLNAHSLTQRNCLSPARSSATRGPANHIYLHSACSNQDTATHTSVRPQQIDGALFSQRNIESRPRHLLHFPNQMPLALTTKHSSVVLESAKNQIMSTRRSSEPSRALWNMIGVIEKENDFRKLQAAATLPFCMQVPFDEHI